MVNPRAQFDAPVMQIQFRCADCGPYRRDSPAKPPTTSGCTEPCFTHCHCLHFVVVLAVGPVAAVPITVHSQGLPSAVSQPGISGSPLFSNNGKTVYRLSDGLDIVNHPAETEPLNLYRYDYGSGITESVFPPRFEKETLNGPIEAFDVSADGVWVVIASPTSCIVHGDLNQKSNFLSIE